jgi:nitrogen fixation/metabolism regulation signal transduction histidine kinase
MAWSEVARQIAHEIKNPLTPIRLAAERIQRRASGLLEGEVSAVLTTSCEAIIAHVSGLQALVDAFHEYARMPAIQSRPCCIDVLVREATALYENIRPGLSVIAATGDSQVWASVDPTLVRQALVNLVDNAAAALGDTGRIEVHARSEGSNTIIEVLDDGPGLPTDDATLLTRPFFSTKGRGSGMGLAIVHRIVLDHDGTLEFFNIEPRGTRVVMSFHNAALQTPNTVD